MSTIDNLQRMRSERATLNPKLFLLPVRRFWAAPSAEDLARQRARLLTALLTTIVLARNGLAIVLCPDADGDLRSLKTLQRFSRFTLPRIL